MTETMTTTGNPALNAAIAAVQAELPKIAKGETADAGSYKYKYAGLDTVTAVIMPLLGKHGLAFIAKPTLVDGKFALAYSLVHKSGEREDGIYPLASSGTPQQIGGLISYARRYALCAITGIAPGGDDDDAQSANVPQRYDSRESFENAAPAPPRNGRANGHATRAEQPAAPQAPTGEPDEDAQQYADEAHEARTLGALKDIHVKAREAHKLAALIRNPATGGIGGLGQYLNYRKGLLERSDKALIALNAAGFDAGLDVAGIEERLIASCGHGIEEASAEEMEKCAAALREPVGVPA